VLIHGPRFAFHATPRRFDNQRGLRLYGLQPDNRVCDRVLRFMGNLHGAAGDPSTS